MIQAAIDNYGGEDVCLMWEAFAAFGLGDAGQPVGTAEVQRLAGFRGQAQDQAVVPHQDDFAVPVVP